MHFMQIKYFIFAIGRANLYKSPVQLISEEVVRTKKLSEKEIDKMLEEIIESDEDIKAHTRKLSKEERDRISSILKEGRKGRRLIKCF